MREGALQEVESTVPRTTCAHCGDPCPTNKDQDHKLSFCCLGCQTVYQVLHENGLDTYYELEERPGVSFRKLTKQDYTFLDEPQFQSQILTFRDNKIAKVQFILPGIHCSSCLWLLENLYRLEQGVLRSRVNFPRKEIYVDFDPNILSLRQLVELLSSLGYPPELALGSEKAQKERRPERGLLIKLGVAGFSFGNIMLLAFPEYTGLDRLYESDYSRFFSFVSLILVLPVVLYSGVDYFTSAIKALRRGISSIDIPIAIGILALFSRSVYEIAVDIGPGYFDSLAGLIFFLLIGRWFQAKTYASLYFHRDFRSYFPLAVNKRFQAEFKPVSISELMEGDVIQIRNAEVVPTDARILDHHGFVDNSFITGESERLQVAEGDTVYAGARWYGQATEMEVVRKVSQSYLTQLWNEAESGQSSDQKHKRLVDTVSKYFTPTIISLATAAAIFWLVMDPSKSVTTFTAVLIVACPCALALSTPFATGAAMRYLGDLGLFLKNGDVVEGMARTSHVVVDKTGTLTLATDPNLEVITARPINGELSDSEQQDVVALASNSVHPISRGLVKALSSNLEPMPNGVTEYHEEPGRGIEAKIHGHHYRLGSSSFVGYDGETDDRESAYLSIDGIPRAAFHIPHEYREGFAQALGVLGSQIPLTILSGDKDTERAYLHKKVPQAELLFGQTPFDKQTFVEDMRENGAHVLMVGDGLNDSGALKVAEVGIAVTDDVSSFTPASDAIMKGSNLGRLDRLIDFSRGTVKVIVACFVFSFLYNVIGLTFAMSGNLTPVFAAILMPLSSISVVALATGGVAFVRRRLKLN